MFKFSQEKYSLEIVYYLGLVFLEQSGDYDENEN